MTQVNARPHHAPSELDDPIRHVCDSRHGSALSLATWG